MGNGMKEGNEQASGTSPCCVDSGPSVFPMKIHRRFYLEVSEK